MASKGKGIAVPKSSGKRKRGDDDDNAGKGRRNRSVLQFFEDAAFEDGDGDSDSASDDFLNDADFQDDYAGISNVKSEPGRFDQIPFLPKEEELSGDELEKMLEERYGRRSGYVKYAEDDYDSKRSMDKSALMPSVEPTIWKVKCKVGREKNTVFCLIQKYVDLKNLGTKLQIISAFAVEHIKGFVFVEAERQSDVTEACNQLADVYFSLVTQVPSNEVGQLLVVKKRYQEVKEGTWARVKNGIYRGDLAQVVAVNNERKKATVKLIPRIDLQALTEKYGGGGSSKRTKGSVPAARLINSSDLEEFRPLIQYRRDRDTGKMFEFLDSLMLKDGFLYKKVSIDSLSFWGVNPSEDEIHKFTVSSNDESDNMEWLSQLYGEPKKKPNVKFDKGGGKGGGKGEGSSGSQEQSSFEVHDLVHFGKRDFGMVVGMEKDETYKILKDSSEGPVTLTLGQKELKYVPLEKKFTALDHRMKTISINDTVRILEGPVKERQGTVKQVYRGVIFLYDENDLDNAYFCTKSQLSEKVKHSESACHGKDEGPSNFEDVPSSPKSPLSPKKPWQTRGNNSDADRTEKDGIFSVGQSLRIRIGPLKGYLCRVLAVRYSDVTVKLDSQHRVLTVKREHLSEARGRGSASLIRDDPDLSSPFKPFDLLGTEGNTNDWLQQPSGSADGDGWNVGGMSNERSAWPAFPSSGASLQAGTEATDLPSSAEDTAWLSKVSVGNDKAVDKSDQDGGWGTSSGGWDKAKAPVGDLGGSWNAGGCSSSQEKANNLCETDPWTAGQKITNAANSWGSQSAKKGQPDSWDKGKHTEEQGGWNNISSHGDSGSSGWGKSNICPKGATWGEGKESVEQSIGKADSVSWGEPKCSSDPAKDSWGKAADGWGKKNNSSEGSEWRSSAAASQSQAVALAETHTGWGQRQGQNASGGWKKSLDEHPEKMRPSDTGTTVHETWSNAMDLGDKSSEVACEDPWGKVVEKSGDKDSSSRGNEWRSSTNKPAGDVKGWGTSSGGWTNAQEQNSGAGGWKSSGDCGAGDSWSNSKSFGADNKGGNDSWGQSKNFEDDREFCRGNGPSGRGRGRDQFSRGRGRGRGRSFDRGQFSSCNKDSQDTYSSGNKGWKDQHGSSWGNSSVENGLTSSWGTGKSWNDKGDDNKGWHKSNKPDKDIGGLSLEKSPQTGWNGAISDSTSWGTSGKMSEEKAMDGWKRDATSTSSGWTKGGDLSQGKSWDKEYGSEARESWSKSAGNNSWEKPNNSDNDQGFGWGHGSGGRRGGRGFRGGRDQSGRGGRGRSGGRGQFSSWKNEGQDDSSGRNSEGSSWSKGGWSADGGGEDRSWKKPCEGGTSWGGGTDNKTSGDKSSWSKGWSSGGGRENKGWGKPNQGGPSWGGGSFDKPSGGGSNEKPGQGGSSWEGGSSEKPSQGGLSWGAGSFDKPMGGGSSWGGGSNEKPSQGGSSWGGGGSDKPSQGGSSWGGGGSEKPSQGGSSWGGGDGKKPSQGGSSWGGGSSEKPSQGGSSWGGGSTNKKGGWGNSSSGRSSDAGGWGN